MRKLTNILVTGGAGFIGSHFIKYLFNNSSFKGNIINIDKLTYAGNLNNLIHIDKFSSRYLFIKEDICNKSRIKELVHAYNIDTVVHFAAESHVDKSIMDPFGFIQTNIVGTYTLLEIAKQEWGDRSDVLFHHVSTDEVFGSLDTKEYFNEQSSYDPRSPYAASKASSDHLVRSYYHTYNLPITISNCSNNYGPNQHKEKLIPTIIYNILNNKSIPIYGNGQNIRDWLYVEDHVKAIWTILQNGKIGESYNIGGNNEYTNISLATLICEKIASIQNKDKDYYKHLITHVTDRLGHDLRYAIDASKIIKELHWTPSTTFSHGIDKTINWYMLKFAEDV